MILVPDDSGLEFRDRERLFRCCGLVDRALLEGGPAIAIECEGQARQTIALADGNDGVLHG